MTHDVAYCNSLLCLLQCGVELYQSMNVILCISSLTFLYTIVVAINRNNMGASPDQWDNRMVDHLKNFDLSSPEVRQQFGE